MQDVSFIVDVFGPAVPWLCLGLICLRPQFSSAAACRQMRPDQQSSPQTSLWGLSSSSGFLLQKEKECSLISVFHPVFCHFMVCNLTEMVVWKRMREYVRQSRWWGLLVLSQLKPQFLPASALLLPHLHSGYCILCNITRLFITFNVGIPLAVFQILCKYNN